MKHLQKWFLILLPALLFAFTATSCGSDDDQPQDSIVGKWAYYGESVRMNLTFYNDNTGVIEEVWSTRSSHSYTMEFSWSTSTSSDGKNILNVSYVSGDKNTEIFAGDVNTVLWRRQYVLTGNILNVYDGDGVWVFRRE